MIGAGIVGIATASYLRRDGHDVTVVDMNLPGEYCSFGNSGILCPGSITPISMPGVLKKVPGYLSDPLGPLTVRWTHLPRALPWLLRFIRNSERERVERTADALATLLGPSFEAYAPLVANAGCGDLIRATGYVSVYDTDEAYRKEAYGWKLRRDRGVVCQELDAAGIERLVPALGRRYARGVYLPNEGYVANPGRLTKTLAEQLQRDGGRVLQRKVLEIELGERGPAALITDAGKMPVEVLVICAGAHSAKFAARIGDRVPLEAERGYHVTFSDSGIDLPMPVNSGQHKFFVTPMEMGPRIAGQAEFAGIDGAPNYARADVLAKHMKRMFPQMREREFTRWMGRRPAMPDSRPVIGKATRFPDAYYAFGHGHVGLGSGAPTGRLIAELVGGRKTSINLTPFRVDRF